MIIFPNCKINLGLYVTKKRNDGYHDLATVFYPVKQLFDVLAQWGEVSDRDGIIEVKIIFESGGNAKGASLNPYQKTDYELMVVGENHDGMLF